MKQNQITDLPNLDSDKLENIFSVYKDADGKYFYNLLQSLEFPQMLPPNLFTSYTVRYGDTWPYISFKTLNNPNLWWVLTLANDIQNPVAKLIPGTELRIPIIDVVRAMLLQIVK